MKSMRKKSWLKITLCVLVACAIVGTIISGIMFTTNKGKSTASASVEFSFDGAAEGIAPNGNPFSASDISSDDVLEKALSDAGMADRYTVEQIRKELKITGVYPEDIVDQMTSYESLLDFSAKREVMATVYHPTLYSVVLQNGFDAAISQADLTKLTECILAAYREKFAETAAVGTPSIELQTDLEAYDYPQRLTLLERMLKESADYAAELYEKEPTLRKGGIGFNDIAVKLNNLINTDLDKLKANVTINALTWNKDRLKTQYKYSKEALENELTKREAQKESLTALIDSYKQDEEIYLSTSNGATQIESNTAKTYEALQKELEKVNNRIIEINSLISSYEKRLNDLGEDAAATEETTTESASADSTAKSETATTVTTEATTPTGTTEEGSENAETATAEDETVIVSDEEYDKNVEDLKAAIASLLERRKEIMSSFAELIDTYNKQEINDLTVTITAVKYNAPKLLSGAFLAQAVKVAGPICAVGFMVCLILMIISRRKEEKLAEAK